MIHGHHLPPTLQTAEATRHRAHGSLQETLDALERDLIVDALKTARGNKAKAARALGITERLMGLRIRGSASTGAGSARRGTERAGLFFRRFHGSHPAANVIGRPARGSRHPPDSRGDELLEGACRLLPLAVIPPGQILGEQRAPPGLSRLQRGFRRPPLGFPCPPLSLPCLPFGFPCPPLGLPGLPLGLRGLVLGNCGPDLGCMRERGILPAAGFQIADPRGKDQAVLQLLAIEPGVRGVLPVQRPQPPEKCAVARQGLFPCPKEQTIEVAHRSRERLQGVVGSQAVAQVLADKCPDGGERLFGTLRPM